MKWNPELYDKKHSFVSHYGHAVVELLAPENGEEILDIGCGTGDLAQEIAMSGAAVFGIDPSAEMIKKANLKFPELHFQVGNAKDFQLDKKFDAVFSNATFHWIPKLNHPKVLNRIKKHLKPNGRLIVEMGGSGNVETIRNAITSILSKHGFNDQAKREVWFFPSAEDYTKLLQDAGFNVEYIEIIDRPTPLKDEKGIENWLKMFGEKWFEGVPEETQTDLIEEIREDLHPKIYSSKGWVADYKRLRFKAKIIS